MSANKWLGWECWNVRITVYEKWDLTQRVGELSLDRYVRTSMTVVRYI